MRIEIKGTQARKEIAINAIESADFHKCDLNQLATILNLFKILNIPVKEKENE